MSDHKSPWRSAALTAYFERLMRQYAAHGSRHLVFTPPSNRGSLLTNVEAWALNLQRDYVPMLVDMGRWQQVYTLDHPDVLSREQSEWLSLRWGECAALWVKNDCPLVAPRIVSVAA